MLMRKQNTPIEPGVTSGSGRSLAERLEALSRMLVGAVQSPLGQRILTIARGELNRIENSASLTPNQAQALSMRITQALSQLVAAFSEPRRPLDWLLNRDANAMRLEMALHRVAGITAHLEAILAEYSAMTRQSGSFQVVGAAISGTSTGVPEAREPTFLYTPSSAQCRRVAEGLKTLGEHAVEAARNIENSISGAHATNPFDVTGAIAELYVLVSWLRASREALHNTLWGLSLERER